MDLINEVSKPGLMSSVSKFMQFSNELIIDNILGSLLFVLLSGIICT